MKPARLGVSDYERLRSAVGNGEKHDDERSRNDLHMNEAEASALRSAGGLCAFLQRSAVSDKKDKKRAEKRGEHGGSESRTVAEKPVRENAERRRERHSKGVHRAVKPHARADLIARQQIRHPRGETDGTTGETDAVDYSESRHDACVERKHIAEACRGHHPRTSYRKAALVDFVREVPREGTAAKRTEIHHSADKPRKRRRSAERAGKARDYRSNKHRA